ncbi:NRDE family protein [Patiriisocius marinus]|uniref:Transport and Golgi organisation 2 n=1 Tax=Patiriisocius marinus TaxID=1397112 RepID=A0A5J4IQ00_9FLAO|nr:NRDE family protein [Patiriisocius marinus]GER59845.1 hypothetical protein ULMA_19530 [Patiriisocius marinus]
MCTLTFIPKSLDGFILTSNRDEAPLRDTIAPEKYAVDGVNLLFPKDAAAGGTWIGVSEKKRLICLLNGGFTAHTREESYRLSRGVVVTQLLSAENFKETIATFDFNGIEQFTIVLIDWESNAAIYELVWDGCNVYFEEKPWAPQIWSSSLLYTNEAKELRKQWFSEFLFNSLKPSTSEILDFHKTAGNQYGANALIMDRGFVKTKSITQISKMEQTVTFRYEKLETGALTIKTF